MSAILDVIRETSFPFRSRQGKVRDIYDLEKWVLIDFAGEKLVMIATDRISAFDVVLPGGIPNKGKVLTLLSAFWFEKTAFLMPNHFLALINKQWLRKKEGKRLLRSFGSPVQPSVKDQLAYRAMLVIKAKSLPVECVVRGYLSGSAWEEYRQHGTISGFTLPRGLQESQKLSQPLFTPTTKAESGHDKPISMKEMGKLVGEALAEEMKQKSLDIYSFAHGYAMAKGIIIADTKFEFGLVGDKLILIDELLTPDSSRFWDAKLYKVGQSQPSFDKQPVRDWLAQSGWNKEPPPPELPREVIEATSRRYRLAYQRLTGKRLRTEPGDRRKRPSPSRN
jgi:phosphoribosylaminoimidazole-succinocarboxamide synthase